jgi:hypothetical protein
LIIANKLYKDAHMDRKLRWLVIGLAYVAATVVMTATTGYSSDNSSTFSARFGVLTAQAAEPRENLSKSSTALDKASRKGKYALVLFYRENNDALTKARDLVKSARKKISRKSEIVEVNVTDSLEKDIVNKYGINRSPMPFVLVLAPNGAIMRGLSASELDDNKIADAIGTKGSEQVLKALQQKNMVVLCVQGRKTSDNSAAMRGVEEFAKDPKYGPSTTVVTIDPSDPAEAKFLSTININAATPVAITAVLAPSGSVISTFQGETQKDKLTSAAQAATAPKAGGCCGGGRTCGSAASGPACGAGAAIQKTPAQAQPVTTPQQAPANQAVTKPAPPTPAANAPTTKSAEPAKKKEKK